MQVIRALCPTCGAVDLAPRQIHLDIVPAGSDTVGPDSSYRFRCPICAVPVRKHADGRITAMLAAAGVARTVHERGPGHPETPPGGPPLTFDDLLDLHLLLAAADWFDRACAVRTTRWVTR